MKFTVHQNINLYQNRQGTEGNDTGFLKQILQVLEQAKYLRKTNLLPPHLAPTWKRNMNQSFLGGFWGCLSRPLSTEIYYMEIYHPQPQLCLHPGHPMWSYWNWQPCMALSNLHLSQSRFHKVSSTQQVSPWLGPHWRKIHFKWILGNVHIYYQLIGYLIVQVSAFQRDAPSNKLFSWYISFEGFG